MPSEWAASKPCTVTRVTEGKPLLGTVLNTVVRGPRHRLVPQAATIEWPEKGSWSRGEERIKVLHELSLHPHSARGSGQLLPANDPPDQLARRCQAAWVCCSLEPQGQFLRGLRAQEQRFTRDYGAPAQPHVSTFRSRWEGRFPGGLGFWACLPARPPTAGRGSASAEWLPATGCSETACPACTWPAPAPQRSSCNRPPGECGHPMLWTLPWDMDYRGEDGHRAPNLNRHCVAAWDGLAIATEHRSSQSFLMGFWATSGTAHKNDSGQWLVEHTGCRDSDSG